jgi:hypothetical protein
MRKKVKCQLDRGIGPLGVSLSRHRDETRFLLLSLEQAWVVKMFDTLRHSPPGRELVSARCIPGKDLTPAGGVELLAIVGPEEMDRGLTHVAQGQ